MLHTRANAHVHTHVQITDQYWLILNSNYYVKLVLIFREKVYQ